MGSKGDGFDREQESRNRPFAHFVYEGDLQVILHRQRERYANILHDDVDDVLV